MGIPEAVYTRKNKYQPGEASTSNQTQLKEYKASRKIAQISIRINLGKLKKSQIGKYKNSSWRKENLVASEPNRTAFEKTIEKWGT